MGKSCGNAPLQIHVLPLLRSNEEFLSHAYEASRTNIAQWGIKGYSAFSNLSLFDNLGGFTVDLMHCIDRGVTGCLLNLWFTPSIPLFPTTI